MSLLRRPLARMRAVGLGAVGFFALTATTSAPRPRFDILPPNRQASQDSTPLYFEYQVDVPVTLIKWPNPQYPAALKADNIQGEVLLQYVVGIDGRIEARSERILRATHAAFGLAVLATLDRARFSPATVNGKPVRQLVQQSFEFKSTSNQVGIATDTTEVLGDKKPQTAAKSVRVVDSIASLARRFEPVAFDKIATPQSSVIGLLIDEKGSVIHHARITVPDNPGSLLVLMPRLFPDMEQADKSPYTVMSLVEGTFESRSVQLVAVFLKKPDYAPNRR